MTAIVAGVAGLDARDVAAGARLSSDLNLDSLRRVELLGVIEEELGIFVDDDALDPDATVADLDRAGRGRAGGRSASPASWRWPLSPVVRAVGIAFQVLLIYPFVHALLPRPRRPAWSAWRASRARPLHAEPLPAPRQRDHPDPAAARRGAGSSPSPRQPTRSTATRSGASLASVIANAFPLAREGGVRRSLELLGTRLDRGFNILIYPEGKLTVGGPIQPFKAGAGLIAVEGGTPIVPVKLRINAMSSIDRRRFPGRCGRRRARPRRADLVRRRHRPRRGDDAPRGRGRGSVARPVRRHPRAAPHG